MNSVCIMGRIGQEPELKSTNGGKTVLRFSLGVRNQSKGQSTNTDWIDCVAWEKTAEFICRYFQKGSLIAVTGRLSARMYEDASGNRRKATEVVVTTADFTGEKSNNNVTDNISSYTNDFVEMSDKSEFPF